jgi:hypothetical protein
LIENCKFEHTNISILYLHLTEDLNNKANSFRLDLKTNKYIEQELELVDNFEIPFFPKEDEKPINSVELERQARQHVLTQLINQIKFSQHVYDLDDNVRENLPTVESWVKSIQKELERYLK